MANVRIEFFPKRKLISPTPDLEAPYPLDVTLDVYDHGLDINVKESKTLSGIVSKSLYSINETFNYGIIPISGDATTEEIQMFLYSVVAGEEFTITDIDDPTYDANDLTNSPAVTLQLTSRWTRERRSNVETGQFIYSFSGREVNA